MMKINLWVLGHLALYFKQLVKGIIISEQLKKYKKV